MSVRSVALACAMIVIASAAHADEPLTGAAMARQFARDFLDGRHAANADRMTPEMQTGFGAAAAEAARAQLVGQAGVAGEISEAWQEEELEGYRRYRVPVKFERATLDLRIVLDAQDRVAGFFVVPHVASPAERAAAATASPPGREIELTVGDGERGLGATLTLPDGDGPFPGVVLIHGSGPHDRDETIGPNKPFRDLAWGLARRGVATLRYDKRSKARPAELLALGDRLTVGPVVIDDARAALKLLDERPEISDGGAYLLGHSLGGHLLGRIATQGTRPAGLVSLAGMTLPLHEKIVAQTGYLVSLDGEVTPEEQAYRESIETNAAALGKALGEKDPDERPGFFGLPFAFYADLAEHDAVAETAALGLPILVLQGERDYQVTLEDFAVWREALAERSDACLVTYEQLDHLFRPGTGPSRPTDYEQPGPVAELVIDDLARWIRDRRCPGSAPVAEPETRR